MVSFEQKTKKIKSIALQTSAGTDIDNSQESLDCDAITKFSQKSYAKYKTSIDLLNNESDIYNCHGLTFASRRTCIHEANEIHKILKDDYYIEITNVTKIKAGDIILYFGSDGDIEHSGIVIDFDKSLKIPRILSKWGSMFEAIHSAFNCPYNASKIKYYRCKL